MGKWMPVEDGEVTRGLAAMIVFNGLHDYADCRLCRLVPDEGSAPSDIAETIDLILRFARRAPDDEDFMGTNAWMNTRIDAALAWLDTLKGSHDE